jgi:K+-sensing histidine kinase KdpD
VTPDLPVRAIGWIVAVFGPLVISGILVLVRDELYPTNAALVLVLPVLAAAILCGRRGGVVSAVVAALCFDFFFTRPYSSFSIDRGDDIETMVVLLVVGLVVGELVVRAWRSRHLAYTSRREVDQVRRVAELAAGQGSTGRLITVVEREVVELLGARGARFERAPFSTSLPRLGHEKVTIGGDDDDALVPPGPSNEVSLPVWGGGREIGRVVLVLPEDSTGATLPSDDRALAVALVDQLGAVLAAAGESGTAEPR